MRLNSFQIDHIKTHAATFFSESAKVYLFGSRVDDNKRGGDIDLYVETEIKNKIFHRKIKMLTALMMSLGEQKIDLVINNFTDDQEIYKVAKMEGVLL
ncbi:MAG: nucleotidyltransferase domain-containing protein [Candidatus Marinimicrobia bacterium]|nr:nucleotidyltransferase domain-containing protein [Candidatus Neomarinimicrobiota bacterium]